MTEKKVVFAIPTLRKPLQVCIDSVEASIPLIKAAGWTQGIVSEIGCPYISCARATMLRKAMDANADVVVFIDHDLSWEPHALLKLIETEGDVVAGTYRYKREPEEYMGALLPDINSRPQVREDGAIKAHSIPAGFPQDHQERRQPLHDRVPRALLRGQVFAGGGPLQPRRP
jgi:hypothetical protein